jgi:DNA-binding MarR family transcriptional regulator
MQTLKMPKKPALPPATVTDSDYRALADFRYHIRRYLDFSDRAAKLAGIEPKQYQLLLAIKGLPPDVEPTVGVLAERLHIRHHSSVELINRAAKNKFVERRRAGNHVFVQLTARGEKVLSRAVQKRLEDLHTAGPVLVNALKQLTTAYNRKRKI